MFCELTAPQPIALGAMPPLELTAESVGLAPAAIVTTTHPPQVASAGLPFLCVALRDRGALAGARVRDEPHRALMRDCGGEGLLLYTPDTGDARTDLRAHVRAAPRGR